MCAPRSLRAKRRERLRVLLWEAMDPVYSWALRCCLSSLGLCSSTSLPDTLFPVTQRLQAGSPHTRVFDGRRWHRQSLPQQSTHNALAGSGAGALAGFPGRRELSVCGREASKVVCTCGEWGGGREEKKRGETWN